MHWNRKWRKHNRTMDLKKRNAGIEEREIIQHIEREWFRKEQELLIWLLAAERYNPSYITDIGTDDSYYTFSINNNVQGPTVTWFNDYGNETSTYTYN